MQSEGKTETSERSQAGRESRVRVRASATTGWRTESAQVGVPRRLGDLVIHCHVGRCSRIPSLTFHSFPVCCIFRCPMSPVYAVPDEALKNLAEASRASIERLRGHQPEDVDLYALFTRVYRMSTLSLLQVRLPQKQACGRSGAALREGRKTPRSSHHSRQVSPRPSRSSRASWRKG